MLEEIGRRAGIDCRAFGIAAFLFLLWSVPAMAKTVIEGQAVDSTGHNVQGARVSVIDAESGVVEAGGSSSKKGRFEIKLDRGGRYVVRVERAGFAPWEQPVEVPANTTATLEVELVEEAVWRQREAVAAYNRGVEALRAKDLDSAVVDLELAIGFDVDLAEAYAALATIHHERRDWSRAADAAQRFLTLRPGGVHLAPVAFDAFRKTGQDVKAEAALALVKDPVARKDLAIGLYRDGAARVEADDMQRALGFFASATDLDPELIAAHRSMAAIEFNRAAYDQALVHIDRLLNIEPDHLVGLQMRYFSLERTGGAGLENALVSYLDRAPPDALAELLEQAKKIFESGDAVEAARKLQRLVAARPQATWVHYQLGLALASSGNTDDAKRHLRRFISLANGEPEVALAEAMIEGLEGL